jgi:nitrite reductase/ring-hydroxylating ferredoxin subunit
LYSEVAKAGEIAPGGMKAFAVNGREIVVCYTGEGYYAFDRRCGHMNAPLDMGTLDGKILTCGMHHVQFLVDTGEAISGVVPHAPGEPIPPGDLFPHWIGDLMAHVRVCDIRTYPVRVEGGSIMVDVPE